jgi:hypothetical protein
MNSLEQPMAEMSVGTKLNTPELDWSSKSLSHPQRIYSKINVINGVNSGTLSTSTQGAFSFQIPAKVLSLKDSYVSLDLEIATAGNGVPCSVIAGNLGNIFSRVVCTADNNAVLFDINDFHRFGSMLHAPSMKSETLEQECVSDMEFLPTGATSAAVRGIARRSPYNVLQKNSTAQFTATATVPTIVSNKPPLDRFTGGIDPTNAGVALFAHQENLNPSGYRHYIQQTNLANNQATAYSLSFRLKDLLPHTVCSLEQLLYFGGAQLQFDFYINSIDFVGYLAGTAALIASQAQLPATTFSNFQFNLCAENNVNTINAVVNKVKNEGLTIPIPYVFGSKTSIGSTAPNVNQVITRSSGEKLRWVAWSPFPSTALRDIINSHTQLTCTDISGQGTYTTVFDNYNTSLDNIFIKSQSTIDCSKGEHWLYNKNELKGSALQGIELLNNDFVHIDSWTGKSLCDTDPSVSDGLPITENHTWGLTASFTSADVYQHYVYYCMERKLVIGNFSVQVI